MNSSARRWRKILGGGLLLVAFVLHTAGYVFIVNDGGQPLVWNSGQINMQLRLGSSPTLFDGSNYNSSVQAAMEQWNTYIGAVQFNPQSDDGSPAGDGNSKNEITFSDTVYGDAFGEFTLAITTIWFTGSRRVEGDIVFNTAWTWDSYRGNLAAEEDIQRVAIHELGHVLGLDHPDQAEPPQSVTAIMNSSVSSVADRLQADDIAGAQSLYGGSGSVGPPPNDAFASASAITLSGNSAQATGSNAFATKEAGEPNHADDPGGHSAWWKWTAPGNGSMTITTAGSNFDTLLGIYTGASVSGLSTIASNDDVDSGVIRTSTVTFNATGGTTYYIAVDGWDGDSGAITLNLNFSPLGNSAPVITGHPGDHTVSAGQNVQFDVSAGGNPSPSFQWQLRPAGSGTWGDLSNGGAYSGVTSTILSITGATAAMNGDQFRCAATNIVGSATSNAGTLTVLSAPIITTHPSSQTILEGSPVTFTAAASGNPTPTFQWQKGGVNISGATNSSYTIASVTPGDAASYRVVATNIHGNATSNAAILTVTPPGPVITNLSPVRQVFTPGQSLALSVTATGAGTITYEWIHNGRVVAGATGSSLNIPSLVTSDGGWYVVRLTDSNGTRRSAPIFVIVAPAVTQVRGWGNNSNGVATIPAGLTNAVAVSAGRSSTAMALRRDGTVAAWGDNFLGQTNVPAGLTNAVAISTGEFHCLTLKSDGTVVGWGNGSGGQLGIPAGLADVVAISAGTQHSVALKSDGTVVAWGTTYQNASTVPAGLTGVVAIAAGGYHTLALKTDGTVVAWGDNSYGQGSPPGGLSGVVAVATGYIHSLALKSDGTVVAWGYNGDGAATVPGGLTNVIGISGGQRHTLAVKNDGTIVGWGFDEAGETLPPAGGLDGVLAVSAGYRYSIALRDPALDTAPVITSQPLSLTRAETQTAVFSVAATGGGPFSYQWRKGGAPVSGATGTTLTLVNLVLADAGSYDVVVTNHVGSTTSSIATLTVIELPVITSLSAVRQVVHTGNPLNLNVTATGTGTLSYQWFRNGRPVAGATAGTFSRSPATISDNGYYHVYITDSLGTRRSATIFVTVAPASVQIYAWGDENRGATMAPVSPTGVVAIAAGGFNAQALKGDGTVVPWVAFTPDNPNAGFQLPNYSSTIYFPSGLANVATIATGYYHYLALRSDGTVVAWGDNSYGQASVPAGLADVVAIAAGGFQSLALKGDGTVVAWGNNFTGQTTVPAGLANVVAVAAGGWHSLALKADGTVAVWGMAGNTPPAGLSGVTAISAGGYFSLAQKTDGSVVSWGNVSEGFIPSGLSGLVTFAAGYISSLGLKADGTIVAWSDNDYDESQSPAYVPADLGDVAAISAGEYFWLALRDSAGDTAPVIVTQPLSQTRVEAQTTIFSVSATGAGPLSYQWRKGGVAIAGATSPVFTLTDLVVSQAGNYDVVVTNHIGPTTSATAVLTVNAAPVITNLSATRQVLAPGQSLNLSVTATGTGVLSYQWFHNGRPLAGATGSGYAKPGLTRADSGWYAVVITDSIGSRRSPAIFVTVAPAVTQVRAWGSNAFGAMNVPANLTNAIAIASHSFHSLALKADGTVVGWGENVAGSLTIPAGLSNVVQVDISGGHSLALKADGTVVAWGSNFSGQLNVPAGLTDVVKVAASGNHSLALRGDGTVVSWGETYIGQAAILAGLTDIVDITAGIYHSVALRQDGTAVVWQLAAYDGFGQRDMPAGLNGMVAIVAGAYHTLALKSDGTMVAWGFNNDRQCDVPGGLTGIVAPEAGGAHSLALKSDGTIVGWGLNSGGQISFPSDLSGIVAFSAGDNFSQALRDPAGDSSPVITAQPVGQLISSGGTAYFSLTALGAPTYQWQRLPAGSGTWSNISDGATYSGSLTASLIVTGSTLSNNGDQYRCIVSNLAGSTTSSAALLTVSATSGPILVFGGYSHTQFIRANGTLWAMGGNYSGQLGDGTTTARLSPVQTMTGVVNASSGFDHSLFVKQNGSLWAMGDNQIGELGVSDTTNRSTPVQVTTGVVAAAAGYRHSLFRKTDGFLYAMGWNANGQLGDGTVTQRNSPVQIATHVMAVAAGYQHSLFVKTDGTVWATGSNNAGQFGDGTTTEQHTPVQVGTNTAAVATFYHTLFLKTDGTLWAAGRNDRGQVGDGSTTQRNTPVQVAANVKAIAVGAFHSVFLKTDGTLWAMGANDRGQLGDGTTTDRTTPVQVAPNVVGISAGLLQVFFIKTDGTMWAAGANDQAQLGDGTTTDRSTPVQVASGGVGVPGFVTNTIATNGPGSDRIKISWTPVLGAAHYEIWRGLGPDSVTATLLAARVQGVYYEDLSAAPGVSYYYWVKAVNLGGASSFSVGDLGLQGSLPTIAPTIATHPASQTVNTGTNVTFSVIASGTAPFTYQWRKDGGAISGATSSSYTITGAVVADAGSYDIVVTNSAGNATSNPATLTVNQLGQTITFATLSDRAFSSTPFSLSATSSSGLTVSFAIMSGPATISSTSLTMTGSGTVTVRASQAGNATYSAAPDVDRSFTVTANHAFWQQSHFTAGELLDANISGPNAVFGHDGLPNLVKYALGLDPKVDATTNLPETSATATDWVYTYVRPSDRTDVTYTVEVSTDLTNWTTAGVTHEIVSSGGGTETWQAKYPLSSAANCYFRLKVVQ